MDIAEREHKLWKANEQYLHGEITSEHLEEIERSNTSSHEDATIAVALWHKRWLFFWLGTTFSILWMISIVGLSAYVFIKTGSFYSFFISAASAPAIELIRRFANYLLPMDEKRITLAMRKMEMKIQKSSKQR